MKNNLTPLVGISLLAALPLSLGLAAPVALVEQEPRSISEVAPGTILLDFGEVAFGNLKLSPPPEGKGNVTIRFGESFKDGRIDQKPPGSVRFSEVGTTWSGSTPLIVAPS